MNLLLAWLAATSAQVAVLSGGDPADARIPAFLAADAPTPLQPWARTSLLSQEAGVAVRKQVSEPFVIDVGLYGRVAFPIGEVQDSDTIVIQGPGGTTVLYDDRLGYADLFDPGLGVTLEAALLFIKPEGRRGKGGGTFDPTFGVYVALQVDDFNGDSAEDDFGNEIEAGNMLIYSAIAGIKVAQTLNPDWFADVRLGFGVAHYEEVDGDFNPAGGGSIDGTLFEASETYVFEFRAHGAWRVGPVALVVGGGFRVFGQPERSDGADILGLDPSTLFTLDVEAGVEIGF